MISGIGGNIVDFRTGAPFDLTKTFLIANGIPILPRNFQQPTSDPRELHELAQKHYEKFIEAAHVTATRLGMRVIDPGIKSIVRLEEKAFAEKDGDASQIFDPLRVALVADRPCKIKRGIDFYSPATNSRTVELLDQFGNPDPESGLRRAKIIIEVEDGFFGEVQIWSQQMMNALGESHTAYERQRGLKANLCRSTNSLPHTAYAHLEAMQEFLAKTRQHIHDEAAKDANLNKLLETRQFGFIGDTPFVAIQRQLDHCPTILRPDALTGKYVEDNALYSDYVERRYTPCTRERFLTASFALAQQTLTPASTTQNSTVCHTPPSRDFN
mgnify:CR=1 FL=1